MTTETTNSTHKAEVVPIFLSPHPNADSLSIVRVYGYTVCVRTEDWLGVDKAVYICPDSILPSLPQYDFLGPNKRIKAKKLRGIISFGMLVPAPEDSQIGDNVAELLGVTHYNPPEPANTGGEAGKAPSGCYPKYDVDSLRRYVDLFIPEEPVVCTLKLHGSSSRYVFKDEMYCGSRTEWKKYDKDNMWWKCLEQHPQIEQFCRDNPGIAIYGECYGFNKGYDYGVAKGKLGWAAFDILGSDGYIPHDASRTLGKDLFWVPEVYRGPFNFEHLSQLAEGDDLLGKHIMEGIVVKPLNERWTDEVGRLQLKLVSSRYLQKD